MKFVIRLIIILLTCSIALWLIRQPDNFASEITASSTQNIAITGKNKNNLITASETKLTSTENKQSIGKLDANSNQPNITETPFTISPANVNFTWNGHKLKSITPDEHQANREKKKKISSPDAVYMSRKFIITTSAQKIAQIIQKNSFEPKAPLIEIAQPQIQNNNSGEPDKVLCPPVEMIKQTASQINDVYYFETDYRIMSDEPVFQYKDVNWMVGITGILASSSDEAIYKAELTVSEASQSKTEYSGMLDGAFTIEDEPFTLYMCAYGSGNIIAIGIWDKVPVEE